MAIPDLQPLTIHRVDRTPYLYLISFGFLSMLAYIVNSTHMMLIKPFENTKYFRSKAFLKNSKLNIYILRLLEVNINIRNSLHTIQAFL